MNEDNTLQNSSKENAIAIRISSQAALYAAYMPFLKNGGLFIPLQKQINVGAVLHISVALSGDEQRFAASGTVAWITPQDANGGRKCGIGLHLEDSDESRILCARIEDLLEDFGNKQMLTHTI